MKKKTMQEKTEDIRLKKIRTIIIFALSWGVTLIFGVIFCIICMLLVWGLTSNGYDDIDPNQVIKNLVIYGLISITFLGIVYVFVRKLVRFKFFRFMSWALAIGIIINFIIFVFNAVGLINNYISVRSAGNSINKCSSLEVQLSRATMATYPIATNLGTGTAFAIDSNGTFLTAYHVVEGANNIYANLATGSIPMNIILTAPEYDIALLKMDKATPQYISLTDNYQVGNDIFAVGYPGNALFAGQASVSSGIVSRILSKDSLALNKNVINAADGLELVQTDAPINPGNSGGAVFNKCGVVGIVSFRSNLGGYEVVSEQGISYIVSSKSIASRFNLTIYSK